MSNSALAAKFPWAAQFANAKLDVALWGDSGNKISSNKKENLNDLFEEIAKLTNDHDKNEESGASFFHQKSQASLKDPLREGDVGDMTETWGGAVAFTNSVQFGNSDTLASEDILAAALR